MNLTPTLGGINTAIAVGDLAGRGQVFVAHPTKEKKLPETTTTGITRLFVIREDAMPIRVLVADDNKPMLTAIRNVLLEERLIEIVGEASTFAATMQAIADFKPDVLVLDLHLPESRNFKPEFVKSQLVSVRTLAVSFSNDGEAKALAESYGAAALLDKMKLYSEMVPAIMSFIDEGTAGIREEPDRELHSQRAIA